ncbi:hypothetical protein [Streptomyces sp. MMBL 11-3]|uniref:hypothetical protein n=1 Tax=Streptomyces sp. MMBL 11-3 TaxID=3382639 RepID=UPI0039B65FAE
MTRTGRRAVRAGGLVAVLALACLGCGGGPTASDGREPSGRAGDAGTRTGAKKVPCREALRFADQERLPAGAEDATCAVHHGIDTLYDIRFRIAGTGLDGWLAATHPDLELRTHCVQEDADRCGNLTLDPYAEGGAVAVELTVRDEDDGRVLVHYRPFDT